jgi:hypothetical protein
VALGVTVARSPASRHVCSTAHPSGSMIILMRVNREGEVPGVVS